MSKKFTFKTQLHFSKDPLAEKALEQAFAYILNLNSNSKKHVETKGDDLRADGLQNEGHGDSLVAKKSK